MLVAVRLSDTSRLGERLMAGDIEALALVIEAVRCAGGDVELAARALRVTYADFATWWRKLPELDAAIREERNRC